MRPLLTSATLVFFVVATLSSQTTVSAQTDQGDAKRAPAAAALTTIFSPAKAPKRKTMGLLQRSFLDLADQGDQELEVAIVVDGTDSMTTELAGVRQSINQMLDDLRRYRNNEVRVAVVVYRDAGSPSGKTEILLKNFTGDPATIENAVARLQPESGAPFFHELADLGLHRALTELPWTDDDQVTKWILMFGDAPPYSASFNEKETPESYRRFATPLLIDVARRKNIRINCVLCTSSDNVGDSYQDSLDETRDFMSSLSGGTDGLMLDLSYEAIRTAMIDASNQPEVELARIEPISSIDVAAARRETLARPNNVRNVSLAVIPHMPLSRISFDVRHPAVQVSTALRTKLARVPGVRVASPRDIKEQLRRLRADGVDQSKAIRGLAARLNVDFVVWGSLTANNAEVQTAAYRRNDGQRIVPIQLARHSDDLAYVLIEASAKQATEDPALSQLLTSMDSLRDAMNKSMAKTPATNDELLTALEALDQALGYESGSEQSVALLETADRASSTAIKAEPRNPIARWLQANVAYNQASRLYRAGDEDAAKARMGDMKRALGVAVTNKDQIPIPSLVTEIEGDYYLLEQRDVAKAIERYSEMTDLKAPQPSQLRGHWMLAGIHAGDWGAAEQSVVDPGLARQHIVEILANWPDSPEASLLKQWLRWNESDEMTEFNYLPKVNVGLSGA